ncbi:antitoxin [Gimibacter soli]|uniref:Antitoxin n=1 Tax=Gimibacter soli TaxID=3024400 RepID=A0AAE9XXP0_9PROT|nr:antitoxin [Gimibacter soli]WCL55614.1 antitoxin [Gimibacter soli]
MPSTYPILANVCVSLSAFKKSPMAIVVEGKGRTIAVMKRSEPAFYVVPAKEFERLIECIIDSELAEIVRGRLNEPEIEVEVEDL